MREGLRRHPAGALRWLLGQQPRSTAESPALRNTQGHAQKLSLGLKLKKYSQQNSKLKNYYYGRRSSRHQLAVTKVLLQR